MKKFRLLLNQRWRGALVGAILGVVLASGAFLKFGRITLRQSFDFPFRFRTDVAVQDIVIIYMDDVSMEDLRQVYGSTWSRDLHAQLLDRLTKDKPELVVFDVLFTRLERPDDDKKLAEAIARNGRVILAGVEVVENEGGLEVTKMQAPDPLFRGTAMGWGLATLAVDSDRGVRIQKPGYEDTPSLAWAAAKAIRTNLTERTEKRWVNYYGPPRTIPHYSYATALGTNLAPGTFTKKLVFIGSLPTASVIGAQLEEFFTPYTRWTGFKAPGVEVHATTFANLIRGDSLKRMWWPLEFCLLALFGAICGTGLVLLGPAPATFLTATVWVVFSGVSLWFIWARNTWFGWLIFSFLQLPATFVWSLIYNSVRLHIDKRLLQDSLVLHLSPARVEQILAHPELLKPGAERQEVTIMFTDIANFSKLSSRMEAEDLFSLLNNYFERALTAVHQNDGTVVKLIGDSIFAIWNAPFVQPDQQYKACNAALELQKSIIELEAQQRSVPLRTRIGIHTGFAFVGNVGSTKRFDYTAIGDNINLASRLEGLNKHLGTDILATRDLHKIIEPKVTARKVGFFRFKGFDRVVEVYELVGGTDAAEKTREWRNQFQEGLFAFERKEWTTAETAFRQVIALRGTDGPSSFYLERVAGLRTTVLPVDWTGEIEMQEK